MSNGHPGNSPGNSPGNADKFALLQQVERLANVGGWYWDIVADDWIFSDNCLHLLGSPALPLTFAEFLANVHPDDQSGMQDAYDKAAADCHDFTIEFRMVHRTTAEERHIRSCGRVVTNSEGNATGLYCSAQDITEQMRVDTSSRENEVRFQAVFNQHYQFLAILSPDGRVLEINEFALKSQGHKREDYVGHLFWESPAWRSLPEWQDLVRERIAQAQTMHKPLLVEDVYRIADGTTRSADAAYTAIRDNSGQVVYVLAQANDTTQRKLTEEALSDNQRKLETLLGNLPGVAYRIKNDARWTVEFISDASFALTGYQPKDLVDNAVISWADLIHPEDRQMVWDTVQDQLQSHQVFELSYRIIGADRQIKWVWEKGRAIYDKDGQIEALEGFINDITENKQIRELLAVSELRFKELFDNSPVPLWEEDFGELFEYLAVLRQDGVENFRAYFDNHPSEVAKCAQKIHVLNVNQETLRLHKARSQDELLGNLEKVFTAKSLDIFKEEVIALASGRSVFESEGEVQTLDGEPRQVFLKLTIDKRQPDSARGLLATMDITDRKEIEAQLRQSQKMESVGRLAGGVAHDYNNALSVIIGFTELALVDIKSTDPMYEDLNKVLSAAERAAAITRQLLAYARKQPITPRVLDLNANVASMLKMLPRLIGEDIDLVWCPAGNLESVRIDPTQVDQILANLCVNARDAIDGVGKITIETQNVVFDLAYCAEHPGFTPGEFVMLAISDDGCGMEQELLSNVFEPFFTTKGVDKGTGLGLATVFGIVKQNLGFINVYSEPDEGTTFKIYLPQHEGEDVRPLKNARAPVKPSRGETVLLVEDELAIMNLVRMILEKQGYCVLSTDRPEEALRIADTHDGKIHLLVTDVIMPKMNGRELQERMQPLYPDMKTLFMSGYTANVIVRHGVLDEGVNFIPKPFSPDGLARAVRQALED